MTDPLVEMVHEEPGEILGEADYCVPQPGEIKPIHPQFHLDMLTADQRSEP